MSPVGYHRMHLQRDSRGVSEILGACGLAAWPVSSLKESTVSSVFSWFFVFMVSDPRTYAPRRSLQLRFECVRHRSLLVFVRGKPADSWLIAQGLFSGSDRRRSCPGDCTPSHPFVNPPALRQAPRSPRSRPPGTVMFSATILRNQARPNQKCVLRDRSPRIHDIGRTEQGPQGS